MTTSLTEDTRPLRVAIADTWASIRRQAVLGRVSQRIAAAAGLPLERSVHFILLELQYSPMRMSDLARAHGTDISTLSRQVREAEHLGLVHRQPDPSDGRAAILSLTAEGRRVASALVRARRNLIEPILAEWSAADMETFARLLRRFSEQYSATMADLPEGPPSR